MTQIIAKQRGTCRHRPRVHGLQGLRRGRLAHLDEHLGALHGLLRLRTEGPHVVVQYER